MGRPRVHDEQVATRLTEEAVDLLAEAGPDALTVRAVAEAAGVSTSAIYGLFGGKEGLLRAVFIEGFTRFDAALAAAPSSEDPVADLGALAHAYRGFAVANPDFHAVMFGRPVPEFVPTAEDVALFDRSFQRLVDAVVRCQGAGRIRDGDAVTLAIGLWGLVHGLATLEVRGVPDEVDPTEVFDTAVRAMMRGLGPAVGRGHADPAVPGARALRTSS